MKHVLLFVQSLIQLSNVQKGAEIIYTILKLINHCSLLYLFAYTGSSINDDSKRRTILNSILKTRLKISCQRKLSNFGVL